MPVLPALAIVASALQTAQAADKPAAPKYAPPAYQYFADARIVRVTDTQTDPTSYFVYDEHGHVIGEYDSTGNPIQEHVYLGDRPVAVVQGGSATGGTVDYVSTDQLGAPRVITDSSQSVVWAWNSDPFGNGQPMGSLTYNLRFPGQYYDQETGHNYNFYRDYDALSGRYVESDPFGLKAGPNTYSYVGSNPISWTDMYGLCPNCKQACLDAYSQEMANDYATYKKAWDFCEKTFYEWVDKLSWAATGVGCKPSANDALIAARRYAAYKRDKCLAGCSN